MDERLFTCQKCCWCDQCPDKADYICEFFDALDSVAEEWDLLVTAADEKQQYSIDWQYYCLDRQGVR